MKTSLPLPNKDELRKILRYDKSTGDLIWLRSGKIAGCITKNGHTAYLRLRIQKKLYMAHRLIWLLVKGHDPGLDEIDHKDGDGLNNKITNLRRVKPTVNRRNLTRKRSNPYPAGVHYSQRLQKFVAVLRYNGKQLHLGTFNTMLEAYERRLREELKVSSETNDRILRAKASAELYRLKRKL